MANSQDPKSSIYGGARIAEDRGGAANSYSDGDSLRTAPCTCGHPLLWHAGFDMKCHYRGHMSDGCACETFVLASRQMN